MVDIRRVRAWKSGEVSSKGPIVYWMSRDQRAEDNWALLYTIELAKKNDREIRVVFNVTTTFLGATLRQYHFMIEGLREVESKLRAHNIPFDVLLGDPVSNMENYCKENKVSALVVDFSPLKIYKDWRKKLVKLIEISFFEVDAHNIIPCWVASPKLEFAARTIRPKIHKLLPEFLVDFPSLSKMDQKNSSEINWEKIYKKLEINEEVKPVDWIVPGAKAAHKVMREFFEKKLDAYDEERNDPVLDGQSNLSPYFHFGQIAPQRVALEAIKIGEHKKSVQVFLEEMVVRRELADNFCFYNSEYDSFDGFPDWAKKTLLAHEKDEREYLYSRKQFEEGKTHDELWNAAQLEMVKTGKMHGYMRMYWAKKILEWTPDVQTAMKIAIYLNDTYELDGCDPNGYTGIAWSIGGVHDRAWFKRPIFGSIRYMNARGAATKFDTAAYIKKFTS